MYAIDLHAHILPGVDDGPGTMEESLEMIKTAYDQGIRTMIATPHCGPINPDFDWAKTESALTALREAVSGMYPDMLIYKGNELFYSTAILDMLHDGRVSTLAGSDYVLVEFMPDVSFRELEASLVEIQRGGYRPVLAHAERYICLLKDIDKAEQLVERGIYMQLNARSLLRGRLDKRNRFCRKMVEYGLVHFIATDCHNTEDRKPVMKEVIERLLKLTDEDTVKALVFENAGRVINNEFI